MAGLVGFVCSNMTEGEISHSIGKMLDLITHESFHIKDRVFREKHVCASRSHIGILQKDPQPLEKGDTLVWLAGEFYNQRDLCPGWADESDSALMAKLYENDPGLSFLELIDGLYCAVIYDRKSGKVLLTADRYGLRHIYWGRWRGGLAWSSEVKAFLGLEGFSPAVDRQAVREILEVGYPLEDRTLLQGVTLLPPGSVLIWDLAEGTMRCERYWWWDKIQPISGKIDEEEVVGYLGALFVAAVKKRTMGQHRLGLTLSGGLDSRAILAAMPEGNRPIHSVTFGNRSCDDAKLAEAASRVKGTQHHLMEINKINWIRNRSRGVWWTDGHMSFQHMHGIEGLPDWREFKDISLNGFAGDLVLGGGYIGSKEYFDKPITVKVAAGKMACDRSILDEATFDKYQSLPKMDYYFLDNRVRRFTVNGPVLTRVFVEVRKPFFDNELMEFGYSLPDRLRFRSNIYKKMLLRYFPAFFQEIPWQRTGLPISRGEFVSRGWHFMRRVRDKMAREAGRFGLELQSGMQYTDYANWIRKEPASRVFRNVLQNPEALYPEFVAMDKVTDTLTRHMRGENQTEQLCRYLTLEIWLQQIFNGRYREESELSRV